MSSWGATLRIARRDARRAKGRSLLVIAMIALPVLGITALDVAARTFELSPEQAASRDVGAADVALGDSGAVSLRQFEGGGSEVGAPRTRPLDLTTIDLPAGSSTLRDRTQTGLLTSGDRKAEVNLRELAYTDPLARGLYRQVSGRAPQAVGETALTEALSERLGAGLGDQVRLSSPSRALRVVGVVADGSTTTAEAALVTPGVLPARAPSPATGSERLLVDLPQPVTAAQVQSWNAQGVSVRGRGTLPGIVEQPGGALDVQALTAVGLVAGMALLEIVLLAGPAFAVGTKRQSRELALIAATGGDRRDVRRTVLGGGLVLGVVAGIIGSAGGIGLAALAVPHLDRFDSTVPGPFDVRPLEVGAIALLGVGTAVLAAVLPAVLAARQDVVAALTGRRGVARGSRRVPAAGAAAAVVGAVIALEGARQRDLNIVLGGSIIAELGLVALTPLLVGAAGRLGPLLPAAPRLALRDASRNRGRTAPAVSAIMAAVAGSVAVGTVLTSVDHKDRAAYTPSLREGITVISTYGASGGEAPDAGLLRRTVAAVAPVQGTTTLRTTVPDNRTNGGYVSVETPAAHTCDVDVRWCQSGAEAYGAAVDGTPVGDARALQALTGETGAAARRALEAGGVVVPAQEVSDDGTALLSVSRPCSDALCSTQPPPLEVIVPAAAYSDGTNSGFAFLSPAAAERLGARTADTAVLVPATVTRTQEDQLRSALDDAGFSTVIAVERGYQSDYGAALYLLVGASALLVLGASGMATGLAAADGRADLGTLAAVGATPGLRRRLAGFQSVVTAGLGTVLGVAAGLVPALGLIGALNSPAGSGRSGLFQSGAYPYVLPWTNLAVTLVVVPVLAGLAAVALTRSRLPLVRRAA